MSVNLTIIIPVYNSEKTIKTTIESVQKQVIENIEIVVIDDGSTDSTGCILDELSKTSINLKVLHKENAGVSSARNAGLKIATGDYIGFVDADDWIEPDMYETMVKAMEENDAQLVSCDLYQDEADVRPYITYDEEKVSDTEIFEVENPYRDILLIPQIAGYLCNKLFKKDLITQMLDEELSQNEDLLFVVQYLKSVTKMVHINKKLYHYRMGDTTPRTDLTKRSRSLMSAYEKILDCYISDAPSLAWLPRRNLLKIYLNFKARYKISNMSDHALHDNIQKGIKKYLKPVLRDHNISLGEKLNILMTWMFPKLLLTVKNKQLSARHKNGDWSK